MSDILEFITRVVPWGHGVVNLHWKPKDRPYMRGLPFLRPDDLLKQAFYFDSRPVLYGDLYYCLSSQLKTGKTVNGRVIALREKDNVDHLKAIWVDIDFKDSYTGPTAALVAIHNACEKAHIPIPSAIVLSGGGLHVYWISDKPLSINEWITYSDGLKKASLAAGLKADWGCTTDSVRVFRVPGTINHKTEPGRQVKLLGLNATDYAFESSLKEIRVNEGHISHFKPTVDVCDITKFTQQPIRDDLETIGLTAYTDLPLAIEPLLGAGGCPHLQDAFQTNGALYAQPLWHLDALLATFLKDGRRLFHRMSKGHKAYDPGDADRMFDRKVNEKEDHALGWPSCAALEAAGCKLCEVCPHKGKIRSPLNLTRPAVTPLLLENVGTPTQVPTSATPFEPNPLRLPRHYKAEKGTEHFILQHRVKKILGGGQPHDEWEKLILDEIWDPYVSSKPSALNFTAHTSKGEIKRVCLLQADTTNPQRLADSLSQQDVSLVPGKKEVMAECVTYWMDNIRKAIEANESVPYGWVIKPGGEPDGFVYGGKMYRRDGTERQTGKDDELLHMYSPTGNMEPWFKALKLITGQDRIELEAIVAASFASPLIKSAAKYSCVLVAESQSSTNKSTAVDIGSAVWGNPKLTKGVHSSSIKGLMKKMSDTHNLPCYWDDVRDKKLDEAVLLASVVTEGQEGIKLTSRRDYADTGDWQSIMVICSNRSIFDAMLKISRTDAASLYRVFEFTVPVSEDETHGRGRVNDTDASRIIGNLEYNFGNIGKEYAIWLGNKPDEIDVATTSYIKQFGAAVQQQSAERFWVALCGTIYAGAYFANQIGADFHLDNLWTFLKKAFFDMRERVKEEHVIGGSEINSESYLGAFLKEQNGSTMLTKDLANGSGRASEIEIIEGPDFIRFPTSKINVHWIYNKKLLRISRSKFREYLIKENAGVQQVLAGLKDHFGMAIGRGRLNAGTKFKAGPEDLLVFPVKDGSWLDQEMHEMMPRKQELQG